MWLNDDYYNELVKVLSGFSESRVDFDEERFEPFDGEKYNKLTKLLKGIKVSTKTQINSNVKIMTSLEDGSYAKIDETEIKDNDFKVFYEKYNLLVNHHERMAHRILRVQSTITGDGKIDSRVDTDEVRGKWFDVITNVNLTLESLATPIEEISTVIKNVAVGKLNKKMRLKINDLEISGDFLDLAATINTMVDQLAIFSSEVTRVAKDVGTEGILGGQAKVEGVSGTWLEVTNNVNGMANNLTAQVRSIAKVTTAVAKGDLSQKITVDAKGEMLELKGTINVMVDQLSAFSSEVTRVAKDVGTEGILGGQARVEGVSGTWLELTNNVNGMANNLTTQVRNIAEVTTAVAKGDLSQKITVDAKGEVLELKGTINVMVDQLSAFSLEVTRVAKDVGTEGILGGQARVEGVSGTWLELTNTVNGMANNLTSQVRNIAEVTTAVAEGDLSQKITVDAKGEMLELKGTINVMVDQLSAFASEVTRVAKDVGTEGILGGQAKVEGVSGTWLELTNTVNGMANNLTTQVRNIAEVTTAVAKGDLSQKITADVKGEVLELKSTINVMVDQLSAFSSEVTRVAKDVGTEGILGGQAKVEGVSGTWLELTNNVNGMANNLTTQVRNIAEVTTAVAKGDLSQKITADAKGEMLELKGTINVMVDQLSAFASEVTRVAKDVGTEGILGGQARVEGVSGTWLELTNTVNGMANNLTTQVRNIAEVTTAVAEGDLSQKITVDAKGEMLELKSTINVMVDQLSAFASEVTRVAKDVGTEGILGGQAKVEGVSGTWLELTNNVNGMANNLTTQVRNIAEVTTAVAKGDLSQKITADVKGEVLELKSTINVMVDQLSAFSSEVTRVAKDVGTEGILGGQAKVKGVSGTWLELTNNVNGMANNLTAQVRSIAKVTTAVAKGDLSQKITVDAKGEVLELKGTINVMVDQLSAFSSEVTRVAKDVGTEGILGGQAKVEGVSGTWLELTNNVNGMANNLTTQVRNIAEVTTAVAKGDLSRSINIDTKGEFLELKNNINGMINVLSTADENNKSQNWIKDGVSLLNTRILDNDKLVDQIETSINELSRYVNAGMGALYIYDIENEILKLEGSYAYTKRADVANSFKIGEGVVGQVAYEKKPILLSNVPDGTVIQTGTTKAKALNIYTYPLIFKGELIAVVEVASYEKFNAVVLEYIDLALTALAGSLYISIQANATSNLLSQSKTQTEELEEQSRVLKSQNEELEDQRQSMDVQRHELKIKNTDLELAQVEVNQRAQDLEDANRYKSEFLANMSHELRTPLNSMLLLSGSLAKVKEIEPSKLNKQASTIYDAGSSLLNLINDILDLSKIEAKLMTLNIEKINISSFLDDLKALFMPQSDEKNIRLESTIYSNSLSTFSSDKTKITQVLRNFLSNAIKFTDNGGTISIQVALNTEEDKNLRPIAISVVDNGIGIEEDNMDLIFEAFKQADGSTSRQYGGTGLGLSISKELTGLLDGRIAVTSIIGEGSTFCIYLPLKINTDVIDARLVEHIQYESTPSNIAPMESDVSVNDDKEELTKQDFVILVVEDDPSFANIILENIHKLGHKAIVACDGNAAISMAKEYKPTAIILDVLLPIINGIEVLRILKSDINIRHIPIIILSSEEPQHITRKLGAIDFISKPIQEDELDKLIIRLVEFVNNKQKNILIVEDEKILASHLELLLTDKDIFVKTAGTPKQGLKDVLSKKYDCVIVSLGPHDANGFKFLELVEEKSIRLPIIIYAERDLTNTELMKVRKYSDTVVLKIATSNLKLIEEMSLFLHSIKSSLNEEKQQLLIQAMNSDQALEGKKILMVDDDIRNIYALSSVLEDKGLDITSAQNGKEALALLNDTENEFDIVLMDIMMPVMDGYEAMKEIRKDNKINNIPIIALTAKAQAEDKKLCIDAGANDYMAKPIDHEQLLSLLKVWLTAKSSLQI
jgi:HAMP domain-containing protein/signal transduction histidine kinase/DNA-binding response OmpR family regulator